MISVLVAAFAMSLSLLDGTWLLEHDRESLASFDGRTFRFTLGPGAPRAQFAALVTPIDGGLSSHSGVTFTASANRPLRVNVDLRPSGTNNPPRWRRSVYLDQSARTVTVRFDDMKPTGTDLRRHSGGGPSPTSEPPPLAAIGALMFTIDTNNTRPATSGEITFSAIALER